MALKRTQTVKNGKQMQLFCILAGPLQCSRFPEDDLGVSLNYVYGPGNPYNLLVIPIFLESLGHRFRDSFQKGFNSRSINRHYEIWGVGTNIGFAG